MRAERRRRRTIMVGGRERGSNAEMQLLGVVGSSREVRGRPSVAGKFACGRPMHTYGRGPKRHCWHFQALLRRAIGKGGN